VFIIGESGTGKELIAHFIHQHSRRSSRSMIPLNCAALPETLLESEMFGHAKGAFTGAVQDKPGLLETAHGGTLFLDEITEMRPALQAKLLRVIQDGVVRRVGSTRTDSVVNVRFISATNRDLAEATRDGVLREDLYYRLAVVTLMLPPLRDRGHDLDLLALHFFAHYAREHGRPVRAVAEEVFNVLRQHPWPGNVRQLRNATERAVVMADGEVLLPNHLPADILHPPQVATTNGAPPAAEVPLVTLEEMERRMIRRALRETGRNVTLAAERLGIHRNTLRRKIADYQIDAN
jgi:transcriptional regulator with PAS, ATPase and Fis domain